MNTERLCALCKLWGVVKFFHPFLAYRSIDWDVALVSSLPAVNQAENSQDFAAAVGKMLSFLDDPATHVLTSNDSPVTVELPEEPLIQQTKDGTLIVTLRMLDFENFSEAQEKLVNVAKQPKDATGLLFDLRLSQQDAGSMPNMLDMIFANSGLDRTFATEPVNGPGRRSRMYMGYQPQKGNTSGGYYAGFQTIEGKRFAGTREGESIPIVFLINQFSVVPTVAFALQSAGKALIIADGSVNDLSANDFARLQLSEEVSAVVRLSEPVYADNTTGSAIDVTIDKSDSTHDDAALALGLETLRSFHPSTAMRNPLPAPVESEPDKLYADMAYPPLEYRLLAIYRAWNTIYHFFPYKDLMDGDWSALLPQFIQKMVDAENATDYALTIAELMAHVQDSHVGIRSQALNTYFGVASPPFVVRWIEDALVVTRLVDEDASKAGGVDIGDLILSIDDEETAECLARLEPYIRASTPQSKYLSFSRLCLNGQDQSIARLRLQRADGTITEIEVERQTEFSRRRYQDPDEDEMPFKLLTPDIGYANLDRLPGSAVDDMFDKFQETKAIIFDMRGYPHGTAWQIAPRLSQTDQPDAARFVCPVRLAPDIETSWTSSEKGQKIFVQTIPPADKPRYSGLTVMLIDERAISQAEHTGLFFKAANNTILIGSPTIGANGDVTNFTLPGDITVSFTGQAVTYPDGRQLQRMGLIPDIEARPTIQGIREGRDEVLEAALVYIAEQTTKQN